MDRNNNLFILSGFISVSIFTACLTLFFYMLFSSEKFNTFALKKDNYISVSIDISPKTAKTFKHNIKTKLFNKNDKKVAFESKEAVDIGNLFSDVWTRKIVKKDKKKKNPDIKRLQEIQRKSQLLSDNEVGNMSDVMKKESKKSSTSNEVNEYLAKIQGLVYEHFFPPQNSQGYSVKAVIELSAIGKVMDFRILNYSANSSLNNECDQIKARLMGVIFPLNPQKKSGTYIVILKSKEEF